MTAHERKERPVYSGVLKYFPKALMEIARVSYVGNEQHNPGETLRWDRSKSTDEADALLRHLLDAGTLDTDGLRHTAKMAWRGLAMLEKELEAVQESAAFNTNEQRVSHDERYTLSTPCTEGCGRTCYPPGACLSCQRAG